MPKLRLGVIAGRTTQPERAGIAYTSPRDPSEFILQIVVVGRVPKNSTSLLATQTADFANNTSAGALVMGEKQYPQSQAAKTSGKNPKSFSAEDFALMSVDDLWDIYQKAEAILAKKIATELSELKRRLARLTTEVQSGSINRNAPERRSKRRPYPKVMPKYQNPAQPSETWSGRGKVPRWLAAQLSAGKKIDNFRIK